MICFSVASDRLPGISSEMTRYHWLIVISCFTNVSNVSRVLGSTVQEVVLISLHKASIIKRDLLLLRCQQAAARMHPPPARVLNYWVWSV